MIDPTSRYADVDLATTTVPDGAGGVREVRCLRRRFPPPALVGGAAAPVLAEHIVTGGDRLDLIADRYLGDPTAFWRICDAAAVIHPDELVAPERIGTRLTVPGG